LAPPPAGRVIVRRVLSGAALGLGAALVAVGTACLTHAATLSRGALSLPSLVPALLFSGLIAVRDELVLRGVILAAFRHTLAPWGRLAVCGAVAAAAMLGTSTNPDVGSFFSSPSAAVPLVMAGIGGVGLAALWQRERGAFMAVGANAAWALGTGALSSAGGLDVRWANTPWGGGSQGALGSPAVALALAVFVAAVFAFARFSTSEGFEVASGNDRPG
jgi:hypothetical protein